MTRNNQRRLLALLALLGAASAGATCTDSMSLASFVRTDKHFRLTANGVVDSSRKSASYGSGLDLQQAVPVTAPVEFSDYKDSLLLPVRFAANCGSDSVSQVRIWRGVDSAGKDKYQADVRVSSGSEVLRTFKPMAIGGVIVGSLTFSSYWPIESADGKRTLYYFGVLKGGSGVIGALTQSRAVAYKGGHVVSMQSYPMVSTLPGADELASTQSTQVAALLNDWKAKLSDGTYDSATIDFRSLDLKYDFASTGVAVRAGVTGASVLRTQADGWLLASRIAAPGAVRTLDGRLLRRFPAGTSFLWDGRNSQGQQVTRGVYLMGFEGQAFQRLVVP